jgi:hypothetical protein
MKKGSWGSNPYANLVKEEDQLGVFFTITNASASKWCKALEKFKDVKFQLNKMAQAKFNIQIQNDEAKRAILEVLQHKTATLSPYEFIDEMGFPVPISFTNAQGDVSEETLRLLMEQDAWKFDTESAARYMYPQKFYAGDQIIWTGDRSKNSEDQNLLMFNGRKLTLRDWDDDFAWVKFIETGDHQFTFKSKTYESASVKIGHKNTVRNVKITIKDITMKNWNASTNDKAAGVECDMVILA